MGLFKGRLHASGLCRLDNCNNSERSSRRFMKSNMTTDDAPYQMLGQKTWATILGYQELYHGYFWLSLLSECLSCYLYVFIVCSTRISWTGSIIGHEPNLIAMSLSSGIAMMLLIFTFRTVHVNPALTLSFLLTGRIPVIRAILYIFVHCLGSLAAIAFLYSISIKGHAGALGLDNPHETLTTWQILIVEIVISFVVTLATYATCNYSSYTCAKKITLEQYGRSCGLFQPTACDNSNNTSASQRHLRCPVAPIVPNNGNQLPSTSVTLHHNTNRIIGGGDLMNMGGNNHNNSNQIGNGTKPYLISNHYNQVYDQYEDGVINSTRSVEKTNDELHSIVELRPNHLNQDINQRTLLNNQTMKNNVQLNNFGNTQPRVFQSYSDYSNQYDYEYDNHRIYATQQLKSESSSQVPIEEVMQDECKLLAPNGFSLHMTSGQALVIGLAYTLTSLSGIPASGASLNPARSFGPAFIMNRWDRHWIYWLGPILGAVIAGFFYEFVFSPTRKSSLCYRPKLFRFSAHDMAKVVGPKSRLYQQQQQKLAAQQQQPSTFYRPQSHHQTIHQSPSMRTAPGNQISNSRQQSHWSSQLFPVFNMDNHSSAALGPRNCGPAATVARQADQVVYDDPTMPKAQQQPHHHLSQFATSVRQPPQSAIKQQANHRRSLILANGNINQQQRFNADIAGLPPAATTNVASPIANSQQQQQIVHSVRKLPQPFSNELQSAQHLQHQAGNKPIASVRSARPMSMAEDLVLESTVLSNNIRGQQLQRQIGLGRKCESLEQLDDDLYNVLSEPSVAPTDDPSVFSRDHIRRQHHHQHHTASIQPFTMRAIHSSPDYSNNINGETASDSSQRTNEMNSLTAGFGGDRSSSQSQNSGPSHASGANVMQRDYVEYYN